MHRYLMKTVQLATLAVLGAGLAAGAATTSSMAAEDYPTRPIKLILGYSPGGPTDVVSRLVGDRVGAALGEPVVIENRPGGGSIIGTKLVADAPPDGYTLGMISTGSTIHPSIYSNMPYDLTTDFVPITIMTKSSYVIIVHPSQPIHTLQDLIELAKTKPLNYAGAGVGDTLRLAGELLQAGGDFEMTIVPYGGGGPALNALMGGQTELMISPISIAGPQIEAGTVRAIAVTGSTRDPSLPDVPTVDEAGIPGYSVSGWYGLVAPKGTPDDIVQTLSAAVNDAIADPEVATTLGGISMEPAGGTPEETATFLESEIEKWSVVAERAGLEKKPL